MFAAITCPACQHKFSIPEGAMGKRQTCPNCHSPFLAGKSVAEAEVPMKLQPAAAAPINKTMLGETEPPIKYNCPRCKKPLESPAIEAGTKKPCPGCGQRLQIPAAPAPTPQPNLNKTVLASDESTGVKPGPAPLGSAPAATTVPSSQAAASAPSGSRPILVIGGIIGGGLVCLLLACVLAMAFSGGDRDKLEREKYEKMKKEYADAQKDLEDLKKSIVMKEALMAQQKLLEAEQQRKWDDMIAKQQARQRELDLQADLDRKNLAFQADKEKAAEAAIARRKAQDELDRMERERLAQKAQADQENKRNLDALKAQLDAVNQRAQQATIIVSQPPPPYYPPPWYRHPWGW